MAKPLVVWFLLSLALLITACAGHHAGMQVVGDGPQAAELLPGDARSEMDELPIPPGVDRELWNELKSALTTQLGLAYPGKISSAAPSGGENRINDLNLNLESPINLDWSYMNIGDYDQNGEVNVADITPLALYFGATAAEADWEQAQMADGDGNGEVNLSDITPIVLHFLTQVSAYKIYGG